MNINKTKPQRRKGFYHKHGYTSLRKIAGLEILDSDRVLAHFDSWTSISPTLSGQVQRSLRKSLRLKSILIHSVSTIKGETETDRENEDAFQVSIKTLEESPYSVFAVLDGHGGNDCSEFCAEALIAELERRLPMVAEDSFCMEKTLKEVFKSVDESYFLHVRGKYGNESKMVGSTATIAVIQRDDIGNVTDIWVANIGDSRAVMISKPADTKLSLRQKLFKVNVVVQQLTTDHTAASEKKRIEQLGGTVVHRHKYGSYMVNGKLALSRAFGDFKLKDFVIHVPEISHIQVSTDNLFLCIATKGVWESFSNKEVGELFIKHGSAKIEKSVQELVELVHDRRGDLDVTVLSVDLSRSL